jgi:hypothetical protein
MLPGDPELPVERQIAGKAEMDRLRPPKDFRKAPLFVGG